MFPMQPSETTIFQIFASIAIVGANDVVNDVLPKFLGQKGLKMAQNGQIILIITFR